MNEINKKYIVCPRCNYICNVKDTFCLRCGYNLEGIKQADISHGEMDIKYCPKCGRECLPEQNYCAYCGYSFIGHDNQDNNNRKPLNKFTLLFWIMIIFGCLTYFTMKFIGSVPDDQMIINPMQEEDYSSLKAPSCHEKEVKDYAVQIFKENDYFYKYISPETISDVSLKFPIMNSYNSESDKYYCSGTIFVIASPSGFKPSDEDIGNHYYEKISEENNDLKKKYTRYECEINYASQISQDKVYVTASACGNGEDFNNKGKFSYSIIKEQPAKTGPDNTDISQETDDEQAETDEQTSEEKPLEQIPPENSSRPEYQGMPETNE